MSKAFLDTTILADVLLKKSDAAVRAKAAINRYDETQLPVYAIKEFKAGPLAYYAYAHNKLVVTGSLAKVFEALNAISRTRQRNRTATALEALATASAISRTRTFKKLASKYGEAATPDIALCDEYRLILKRKILDAWRRRDKVASSVVLPLSCYRQEKPEEKRGTISCHPAKCDSDLACCLQAELVGDADKLKALRDATLNCDPQRDEHTKRAKVLRNLYRKPKERFTEDDCRRLGDAYFAFFAPSDCEILTTNLKDHEPLASAVGINAVRPE